MLGKKPLKWRQRPDMTIAVDWDVKHKFKQTNSFREIKNDMKYLMILNFSNTLL